MRGRRFLAAIGKEKKMKKGILLFLAAALSLLLTAGGLAESLYLPDPCRETSAVATLFEKHQYIKKEQEYFDARFYETDRAGDPDLLNAYLERCAAAGFACEKAENFSKYNAYRISGGGFTAYLIADYQGQWVLLTQPGMALDVVFQDDDFFVEEDEILLPPTEAAADAAEDPVIGQPAAVIPDIVIATPVPAPTPTDAPPVQLVLPSPSYEFGGKGVLSESFIQTEGYAADGWLYAVGNADRVVSEYLSRCQQAGFTWTMGDYLGMQNVYAIFSGDQTAFLVTDYGGQALLLVPKGMEKEGEKPDPEAYEKNMLLLTVNGKTQQMEFRSRWYFVENRLSTLKPTSGARTMLGTTLIFTSESGAYDLVMFALPKNFNVNATYTAKKGDRNDLSFVMYEVSGAIKRESYSPGLLTGSPVIELKSIVNGAGGVSNTTIGTTVLDSKYLAPLNSEKSLVSSGDYFSITPVYAKGGEYRGHFEGSFENGAYKISGTFWVEQ